MKNCFVALLLATATAILSPGIEAVGFKQLLVPDPGEPDLAVGLWYPSDGVVPVEPNTRFGMSMALDAPISGTNRGLILISHGYSGWYAGHADTAVALAEAG